MGKPLLWGLASELPCFIGLGSFLGLASRPVSLIFLKPYHPPIFSFHFSFLFYFLSIFQVPNITNEPLKLFPKKLSFLHLLLY